MLASEPVGGQRHAIADGLLNPELRTRFVSACNYLRREVKCTKRQSSVMSPDDVSQPFLRPSGWRGAAHFVQSSWRLAFCTRSSWRNIPISNNVGAVKFFSSVLIRALRGARHFALVRTSAVSNQGSLAIVAGAEFSPTHPSLRSHSRS
jgi:hypothetical protein